MLLQEELLRALTPPLKWTNSFQVKSEKTKTKSKSQKMKKNKKTRSVS